MIYDGFAQEKAVIPERLSRSRDYLLKKKGNNGADRFRSDWAKDIHPAEHFSKWEKLAVPNKQRSDKHDEPDEIETLLRVLPQGSWALQFTFTLATPYLSKGIEAFDLLDNPIIRDKVYEVPLVSASSWKGGLRAAAATAEIQGNDRNQRILRLFGNDRKADSGFQSGRLHCFPTGFQKTTCEVINPHDRARRVGTNPILLECVPAGETGTFTVLYVPFGDVKPGEAATDLELCAQAIHDLLVEWGIGAKKSNGNGLARDEPMPILYYPHKPEAPPPPKPVTKTLTSFSQLGDIDLGQGAKSKSFETKRETFAGIIKKIVPEMAEQLNGGKR